MLPASAASARHGGHMSSRLVRSQAAAHRFLAIWQASAGMRLPARIPSTWAATHTWADGLYITEKLRSGGKYPGLSGGNIVYPRPGINGLKNQVGAFTPTVFHMDSPLISTDM